MWIHHRASACLMFRSWMRSEKCVGDPSNTKHCVTTERAPAKYRSLKMAVASLGKCSIFVYSGGIAWTRHRLSVHGGKKSSHGGTTEEGNCSYLLPRAAAAGSNGTNKGQIRQVPVDEIARLLVYRIDVTRSQLSTNTGILVCLVREIWQFKVFTGKEVTPRHLKICYSWEMATKWNISWDCRSTLFRNILIGFWVYFMWRWILLD